ncbi:MAG: TIGR04283 family arsenosugar biosynthesis glycosyltransferase [Pseudomonadota bacterium]
MTAPLSVVIPTLNALPGLGPVIGSLGPGLQAGLIRDLVISDGGSNDEIAAAAEGLGARLVTGPPGRGGQLRRGADAASGAWLLFLHADTLLPEGWPGAVAAHFAEAPDRAASFRLAYDEAGFGARLVSGWANLRTRLFALPYGDQALLISRRLYDAVGGYPDQPVMEDVALARRLGRRRLRLLAPAVETSFEKYRREGWLRRGAKNWACLAQYYAGVDPEVIAARYRR